MTGIKQGIWVVLLVFACNAVFAQNNLVLFHLKDFGNTGFFRSVSLKNDYNVQVSFLPFGFAASVYSPFSIDDAFTSEDETYISDFDKLYQKLGRKNIVSQELNLPVFNLKIKTKAGQFEFGIRENISTCLPVDKEAIKFMNEGNAGYVGEEFVSSLNTEALHYREFSAGYIRDKPDNLWSYGARIKLLTGMSVVRPDVNFGIETGSNVEFIKLSASGSTKISFPLTKSYDENGNIRNISSDFDAIKYFFGIGNFGAGFDVSARYRGFPDWELEFCLENLGFIRWGKNLNGINVDGTYTWNGLDLSNILEPNGFENFLDEAKSISVRDSIFTGLGIEDDHKPFTTVVPASALLSAKYILNKNLDVAIVDRIFYSNRFILNSFALSGNMKVGRYFALSTGLLIQKDAFRNIMFGCGVDRGNVSFFMGSDNIATFFNPSGTKNISLSLGLSYRFIHRSRMVKKMMKNMPFYRPSRV